MAKSPPPPPDDDGEAKDLLDVIRALKGHLAFAKGSRVKLSGSGLAALDKLSSASLSSRPILEAALESELSLEAIREKLGDCRRCALSEGRTNIVFGVGDPQARLMFIGEGPGRDEDIQGEPFVGAAGGLLTKGIIAIGLSREQVYIANVVKCRPPGNRTPQPEEMTACLPFLKAQIAAIRPKVICLLGSVAVKGLLGGQAQITKLRGKWTDYLGIPVMPTYHPAYLLRNPHAKADCWEDFKAMRDLYRRLAAEDSGSGS